MPEIFKSSRRVEFRDTDAAGIVHFSVFFAYMEQAEHELLRTLGISVVSEIGSKTISWPRVAANCDYRKAIRFEQIIHSESWVQRIGNKSVTYGHRFYLNGGQSGQQETVAEGTITVACCEIPRGDIKTELKPIPIEIPAAFVEKLKPYLLDD